MNVGGHRVTSEELRSHFEAMGFAEVRSFRASGNVVFAAEREPLMKMTSRIEAALAAALGYGVPTFLRTAGEVLAIAAAQPFATKQVQASRGKLQVILLSAAPPPHILEEVLALATREDRLAFSDRELYWLPSGGILESALDLKAIAKLLGPGTTRTTNTVEQIASKHFAD
jgi:uncharacterized protein (DUF1697 family)